MALIGEVCWPLSVYDRPVRRWWMGLPNFGAGVQAFAQASAASVAAMTEWEQATRRAAVLGGFSMGCEVCDDDAQAAADVRRENKRQHREFVRRLGGRKRGGRWP